MGLSEGVLHHALSRGRKSMQTLYDDLCALVSKVRLEDAHTTDSTVRASR